MELADLGLVREDADDLYRQINTAKVCFFMLKSNVNVHDLLSGSNFTNTQLINFITRDFYLYGSVLLIMS